MHDKGEQILWDVPRSLLCGRGFRGVFPNLLNHPWFLREVLVDVGLSLFEKTPNVLPSGLTQQRN